MRKEWKDWSPERKRRHMEQGNARRKERYANDPLFREQLKASKRKQAKNQRLEPERWVRQILTNTKKRARKLGIKFELCPQDIIFPTVCPVFNTTFVLGQGRHPQGPSLDRKIPALGYIKGNVSVISQRANELKRDCVDAAELRLVADYIERDM